MPASERVFGSDEVVADAFAMFLKKCPSGAFSGTVDVFVTQAIGQEEVKIMDKWLTIDTVTSRLQSTQRQLRAYRAYGLRVTNSGGGEFFITLNNSWRPPRSKKPMWRAKLSKFWERAD